MRMFTATLSILIFSRGLISPASSISEPVEPEGWIISFEVRLPFVCPAKEGYANSPPNQLFIAQPIPVTIAILIRSADLGRLWRLTFRRGHWNQMPRQKRQGGNHRRNDCAGNHRSDEK